jgi:hypothetical protein
MKKIFAVAFFCLPAFGQAAYSGHGLNSVSAAYGASVCGPPGYAPPCSISDTAIHPYVLPIPNWGPNACDSTSMATLAQCGNLTGAGTVVTTNDDFHSIITRCTDGTIQTLTTDAAPWHHVWQTADAVNRNIWNSDDTAFLPLVMNANQWVFLWDGTTCHLLVDSGGNGISFFKGSSFSYLTNNVVYTVDNATGPGIYLQKKIVTLNQGAGAVSSTNLFDFTSNQCLMNTVNGYPTDPSYTGGSFPLNKWTGGLGISKDETTFALAFSLLGGQDTGYYQTVWTVGQSGCDLWNTLTGVVTHNGTLVGTVSDAPWNGPGCPGGTCGAKGSRGKIHDSDVPNATTILVTASTATYGTLQDGPFFWAKGTTAMVQCGVGENDWIANHAYQDGDRIQPAHAVNAGDYIYQIINGVSGTSSAGPITWNQTVNPVSDTTDGPLIWRNTGVGTAQEYACDGHAWKGAIGYGAGHNVTYHSYTDPSIPLLKLAPVISPAQVGDTHIGSTNDDVFDTKWPFVGSTDVGTAVDLLHGTIPSALYMESYFVSPPYRSIGNVNCFFNNPSCLDGTLGQVRRVAHCYGSGWSFSFDVSNCIPIVSQTGKYMAINTDGMGQFGSTANNAKCNVGARNWTKNNATFNVGDLMMPAPNLGSTGGNNAGAFIYQVQSCSGSGTPPSCTTGSTKIANWPQLTTAGTGTTVDGTITWVTAPDVNTPATSAQNNCRADVLVVTLFR